MTKYRPEIDGLRALSVLSVIFFHAKFSFFKGGYVGVDVFFVISGYLITSIILDDLKSNRFSIWSFYERRVRRILPVLILVMLLCVPTAWAILLPHQIKDFGQSLIATSLFSGNILFWLESGYFEPSSELKPLLHTWSLSVEEQFYLLFPLSLLLLKRLNSNAAFIFFLIVGIISFFWGSILYVDDPYGNFYLLPTRAWQLIAGVLCGFILHDSNIRDQPLFAMVGLFMVVLSFFYLEKGTMFPSTKSTIPVVGTVLIILFSSNKSVVTQLLSFRPLVGLGLISYSAYLVHQPVFSFTRSYLSSEPSMVIKVGLIGITLFLAFVLFRFVETPFRKKSVVVGWKLALFLFISIPALLLIGYIFHKHNGFLEYKIGKVLHSQRAFIVDLEKEKKTKFGLKSKFRGSSAKPFSKDPATEKILILGDSVSYDLYLAVKVNEHLFSGKEFRHQRLDDACFKYLGDDALPKNISRECKISIPRLSQRQQYLHADKIFFSAVWQQQSVLDVLKAIKYFGGNGRELTFVGSANFNDVASLSYQIVKKNIPTESLGVFFARNQKSDWKKQNERLRKLLEGGKARYLDKYDVFCIKEANPLTCPLYAENKPLIYDTGHVTAFGAAYFGRRVYELDWFDR